MKINLGKNRLPERKEEKSGDKRGYRLSFSLGTEFRGLINEILALNAIVLKGVEDPVLKRYSNKIQNASRGLLSVVNDVMDFSKIESDELDIAPVNYNLFQMLNECYEMFYQRAQDKNLKFVFDIDPNTPVELFGDEKRIRQILLNLIYYSLKFTSQGDVTLKVSFERDDDASSDIINLILIVSDSGTGIPQFAMDSLFQISDRIATGGDVDGVDLCLNLTNRLVNLFGGTLNVASEVGRGTTCKISIPQLVKRNEPMGDFFEQRKVHSHSMELVLEKFRAPKAEILMADGLPMNLRMVKSILSASKIKIDVADNGMEALEQIKRKHYDVILLDQELPVMTGGEVMEMISALSEVPNAETPVVLMIPDDQVVVKEVYEKQGFAECLQKPIREDRILLLLDKLLPPHLVEVAEDIPQKVQPVNTKKPAAEPGAKIQKDARDVLDIVRDFNMSSDLLKLSATKFIDVRVGLNFCQGDEDLYRSQLIDFKKLNRQDTLESAMDDEDFEMYRIEVRSLKSAALAIGAIDVASRAKAMEFACKEGRFEFVQMHHGDFIREYKNLMSVLVEMF